MTKMIGIRSFECNKHSRYRALDVLSFCSSFPYLTIKGYVMVLKATMDPKELFVVEDLRWHVKASLSSSNSRLWIGLPNTLTSTKVSLRYAWQTIILGHEDTMHHNLIVHFTKRKNKKVLVTFIMTCLEVHILLIRNSNFVLLAKLFTSWKC